ncbi:hypothetical protein [Metabacillus sp. FJAT-53654]|uniref:Secreted protein n=1 Tax=Metabacillus rhizosphaerae TaxID=3117747 RepID=A0ABZ2MZR3_9BACI
MHLFFACIKKNLHDSLIIAFIKTLAAFLTPLLLSSTYSSAIPLISRIHVGACLQTFNNPVKIRPRCFPSHKESASFNIGNAASASGSPISAKLQIVWTE